MRADGDGAHGSTGTDMMDGLGNCPRKWGRDKG